MRAIVRAMATKKRKSGRPKLPDDRVRLTTTLPRATVEALRRVGNGSVSAGILTLLAEASEKDAPK